MLIVANADMQIYLITKWILLRFAMLCHSESSMFVLVYVLLSKRLMGTSILQLKQEDKLWRILAVCLFLQHNKKAHILHFLLIFSIIAILRIIFMITLILLICLISNTS